MAETEGTLDYDPMSDLMFKNWGSAGLKAGSTRTKDQVRAMQLRGQAAKAYAVRAAIFVLETIDPEVLKKNRELTVLFFNAETEEQKKRFDLLESSMAGSDITEMEWNMLNGFDWDMQPDALSIDDKGTPPSYEELVEYIDEHAPLSFFDGERFIRELYCLNDALKEKYPDHKGLSNPLESEAFFEPLSQ